jgi:hypothetical protein
VSPEVQDVFLSQCEIEQIPRFQAQSDQEAVVSAFHTNQPHYAIFEVLTTIARFKVLNVVTMNITLLSDVTNCICLPNYNASHDRKEYKSTTLSSHQFQVFLSTAITPVSIPP